MEDIIDGSPPSSQRKRRNIGKCHTSQKKSKRDVCNVENGIDMKTIDFNCSEHNSPVGQREGNTLTRSDILRGVHLQEQASKASSQLVQTGKRNNNNRSESRISARPGFLSASQYAICASQSSSAQKFRENCVLNSGIVVTSNCNTFLETQGFTESQLEIMDNDAKLNTIANNQKSISFDTTKISHINQVVSTDSVQLGVTLSSDVNHKVIKNENEDGVNNSQHSVKRHGSIVESILNEWPTSPEKKKKTPSQKTQFSPRFKFDKRLIIRTYLAKRRSPATASRCTIIGSTSSDEYENSRKEICHEEIVSTNVNDEDVDLNTSAKIIDNIQNLSQFYSQSGTGDNDVSETFKAVMDLKCQSLIKPSPSMEDEADFFGFDNISVTLPENFYDFPSDSDDEVSNTSIIDQHYDIPADNHQHHDMLADDDDIFVDYKTQRYVPVTNSTQVNMSATKGNFVSDKFLNTTNVYKCFVVQSITL